MKQLAALCVKRPVFATVLILVLVVFGVFSYTKLGLDRFPKIDFPIITVTTLQPGSAPEDIETEITDKIEAAINTISGIEELRSISSEGISQVIVQFVLEKDVDIAAQDVRDKINGVLPELPSDVEQPTVAKVDPDASPIITVAVSAPPPTTIRDITEYCDKILRRRLETTNGVGQVMIVGGQARQINVNLDPLKLRAYRLTVADVARALGSQNLQIPSGSMKVGATEYTLRTLGRVSDMREMAAIAVANRDGRTITVGDLGSAEDSTEEVESASLYNDTPCVQLNIRKQSGTNTVAVAEAIKERLKALEATMPKGYNLKVVRDQSVFIESSVHAVEEHMLLGGGLAAIVVLLFLANIRATIIAALAIPTSIIAAFAIVKFMGYTLNSITLLALTLSVGIVIDDAIVVMENIFRYIEEKKYTPREAAMAATGEIALAVLAITLSLVAVFLPIAMMEGIVGRFLSAFGITMAGTIIVSMLVSFTLTPMLASRWFKKAEERKAGGSKGQFFYHALEAAYLAALRFSLRRRFVVVIVMIGSLATIPYLLDVLPKNFIPDDDSSEFQVNVQAPEGTSLEATQVLIARIARDVRRLDGVKYTIASVADTAQHNAHKGNAYVRLVNIADRNFSQFEIMDFVRQNILPKFVADNLRLSVTPVSLFSVGGVSGDVQFMISGPDMKVLEQSANAVMADLRKAPGAVDVDSSLSVGKPQYGIEVDRPKAAELGVSIADIANTLRLLVAGDKVSDYNEKGEQYEVHVRSIADVRNRLDELKMVTVPSSKFGTVPLDDVVRFEKGTGPAEINRLARARQVTIGANMEEGASQQTILDAIDESVAKLGLGPEYSTGLLGRSKEMARAFRAFFLAFILAFIFVYLCLAAQFESWLHPITILLSLPLTLPFALVSLWIFGQSINIFSLLGIMVLFAVVKKNSILQIDHTIQLRAEGMPKYEAIVEANRDRLRPILMTTVAFVAGMIPLFISNAEGAAVNKAISGVIIGGQSLSLLLTLLAVPVAYSLFDDLSNFFWRVFGRKETEAVEESTYSPRKESAIVAGGNGDTFISEQTGETVIVRPEPSHSLPDDVPARHP
ncbi:MAG: efflux RND transporter permease subunit [Planctomycetes bacterium]|nr:efflux RND transporter permease subunit [Planctomycetota bacterium]MBU4400963.1 efflux RND transporter permease subunit [Planctomycetota bacterium]MCG2684186.1 efflux RND transporter permease subunit [Planctomycetales bacterium]